VKQYDKPSSIKLEGKRRSLASFDIGLTSAEMNTSGTPRHDEDARKQSKKLWNGSEHERKWSKPMDEENSPGRPGENRTYQVTSSAPRKAPDMIRAHHIEVKSQEAILACIGSRETLRAFGTVEGLPTVPNTP
jgi:hypothetical protein